MEVKIPIKKRDGSAGRLTTLYLKDIRHIGDNTVEISINTRNHGIKKVYVDARDLPKMVDISWVVVKSRNTFYVKGLLRRISGKDVLLHNFIMSNTNKIIDHKDGNGLNNRRENLRVATSAQNRANSRIPITNTTGFKGVCYNKTSRLYVVDITVNGVSHSGGGFKNVLLAAKKYNEMAIKYLGEFAYLNRFTEEQEKKISELGVEKRRPKPNKYGYIGVGVDNDRPNKYKAVISINKKVIKIGNYATAIEAARAYDQMALKYYGNTKTINNV